MALREFFSRQSAQRKVAEFMLSNGIRIDKEGNVFCGGVKLSSSKLARAVGVDRRVIGATVGTILENPRLKKIFLNLSSIPVLKEVASETGGGAIEIIPKDAESRGIVDSVTKIKTDAGIPIRQLTTDDFLLDDPKMTVVTQKPIPKQLIDEILKTGLVKQVVVLK
jgi:hypothetical protein